MKLFAAPVLALSVAMPALACDEAPSPPQPPRPLTFAGAPGVYSVAPRLYGSAALGLSGDGENSTITIIDNDDGRQVEIRIKNDKVSAKVDGKDIPSDRIVRTDEKISILDENGEEIYSSNLHFGIGENAFRGFAFGEGDPFIAYNDWLAAAEVDAEMPKVMLGVHMDATGPALEKQLKLAAGATTLIQGVYEGLPAHNAGLEPYDIIVSVKGAESADPASVRDVLRSLDPGATLELEVIRAGEKQQVTITLEEYDRKRMNQAKLEGSASTGLFERGPGFLYTNPPNAPGAVVISPDNLRWRELQEHSLAAADRFRQRAMEELRGFDIDEQSLHEQIDQLRSRLDEVTEMLHEMLEEAAEAKEKALGEDET